MLLSSGDRIGGYEIVGLLGKGGMGEVYRARDGKLNREVAIKVLPAAFAEDAGYRERFTREAQALAAVNHPNIAAIHGLEGNAIVMELVEGESPRGPMALADALAVARQIAEALEAAHEKGIVHRDLKPGNVKVTADGVVKVLDFGLAVTPGKAQSSSGADSPTLTMRATEAGVILGTASYMSPEQAAGKPVDRRSDIWSFGVVLYELLTGEMLFEGETVSHTLADVLRKDIDLSRVPAGPIRDLLKRCLDRNVKTRLRDIGEARIAIENSAQSPVAPPVSTAPKSNRWPWVIAATAVLLAAGLAATRRPPDPQAPIVFEVNPPRGVHFAPIFSAGGSAISPDGRTLVFTGTNEKEEHQLYVRSLDSLEARVLPGTTGAARPFWSPDSKSIAFVADQKLKRIDVAVGTPTTLCDATTTGRGGDWSESGVILFSRQRGGIYRVPASGGTAVAVTKPDEKANEVSHYYPQFLPDGKRFLYLVINTDPSASGIFAASLDGGNPVKVVETSYNADYHAGSGRLLYIQSQGKLMARQLALDPLELRGDPAIVADGVRGVVSNGYAEFSVSAAGDLFYARGTTGLKTQLTWRDRSGKVLEQPGSPNELSFGSLSPDRRRVSYLERPTSATPDIWVLDFARNLTTRITFRGVVASGSGVWTPDGKYIYFQTTNGIERKATDGSGEQEMAIKTNRNQIINAITPDGRYLLTRGAAYLKVPLSGDQQPEEYLKAKHLESQIAFSPDGRWMAYMSNEYASTHVFIRGFPDDRGKWQVTSEAGFSPSWRGDGKELYWVAGGMFSGQLLAAKIDLEPSSVRVGKPEVLFQSPSRFFVGSSADGRRFLFMESKDSANQDVPMVVDRTWLGRLGK